MGNNQAPSNFNAVPDNEFTPVAVFLKKMGINLVQIGFQDLIEAKNLQEFVYHRHILIPQYTPEARKDVTKKLSDRISDTVSNLLLALITKGITVIVNTHESNLNGEVMEEKETGRTGYLFEGKPLVDNVFILHYGPELAKFIQVQESTDAIQSLKTVAKTHKLKYPEILVIHHNPEVVNIARKLRASAILVDDHKLGFRV